ncbi:unnamed protein product [Peniophora sp. CBMAI 1063]|nr:unnamed protein product [Peniophora sp. CBMAI 1063]
MRAISVATFIFSTLGQINATPARRDGCGSLSGTGDVSNFKLSAVHQVGDAITTPELALIPETPSLFNSWIGISSEIETTFNMTDGGITSNSGAVSQSVTDSDPLFFLSHVEIPPFEVYCSVVRYCLSFCPGAD